jgi:hypothetical protein
MPYTAKPCCRAIAAQVAESSPPLSNTTALEDMRIFGLNEMEIGLEVCILFPKIGGFFGPVD